MGSAATDVPEKTFCLNAISKSECEASCSLLHLDEDLTKVRQLIPSVLCTKFRQRWRSHQKHSKKPEIVHLSSLLSRHVNMHKRCVDDVQALVHLIAQTLEFLHACCLSESLAECLRIIIHFVPASKAPRREGERGFEAVLFRPEDEPFQNGSATPKSTSTVSSEKEREIPVPPQTDLELPERDVPVPPQIDGEQSSSSSIPTTPPAEECFGIVAPMQQWIQQPQMSIPPAQPFETHRVSTPLPPSSYYHRPYYTGLDEPGAEIHSHPAPAPLVVPCLPPASATPPAQQFSYGHCPVLPMKPSPTTYNQVIYPSSVAVF
ncbi:hypothetical protein DIPPA_02011 [Diplonema papillatum]|nr:hypothetical protein DIPPA_02011 [Diplonema papillatum]